MPRGRKPKWRVYKEEMDLFCYGDALWEPSPAHNHTRISLGDVGFIRDGQFSLLFSAGSPLGDRQLGDDVPTTFEQLIVGIPTPVEPRRPGCLRTPTVQQLGVSLDTTGFATMLLAHDASFSFELTGDRGAALVTRHDTCPEDTPFETAFEAYTKRHYKSWVEFAHRKHPTNDIRPVLVSGFDMTRDFSVVVYSNEDDTLISDDTTATLMFASTPPPFLGTWRSGFPIHTNEGPQQHSPPSRGRGTCTPSSQLAGVGSVTNESNQCVFIRYYTMRRRKWLPMFPKVIQAGAGPHDLGPGDNTGCAFPELAAQYNPEHTESDDQDPRGKWDPATDDTNSGSDTVVRNPKLEEYDTWDVVADYVFQNSNAKSVLMHHRDLAEIRSAGGSGDISSLLATKRPPIVVDESGVGMIVCGEDRKLTQSGVASPHLATPVLRTDPTNTPAWIRLINRTFAPYEVVSLIEAMFASKDGLKAVGGLSGGDAQTLIDVIDEVFDLPDFPPRLRRKCLITLRRLCARNTLLPRSLQIPLCYDRSDTPLYRGGYADVWKGEHHGRHVAVKVLRVYSTSDFHRLTSRFCKEVVTWRTLRHPNVLPLLGVTMIDYHFAMASEWMVNGNINEFVRAHRDVNRFELLKDVARGLIYLHDQAMIHGDLKGANILIDQSGHARLADFGLLTIVSDPTNFTTSSSITMGGTTRWMSPELLHPDQFDFGDSRPTKESDCYALGMVIFEVLSGKAPFASLKDFIVMRKVIEGERPERPGGPEGVWFTDDLWQMLNRCWATQPKSRPNVEAVLECLGRASEVWCPPSPTVDDVQVDSDDEWDLAGSYMFTGSSAPPPRLLAVSPTVDSLPKGSSDIITAERGDESEASYPSQPSEKMDPEESVGTASQAPLNYLGEHPPQARKSGTTPPEIPTSDLPHQKGGSYSQDLNPASTTLHIAEDHPGTGDLEGREADVQLGITGSDQVVLGTPPWKRLIDRTFSSYEVVSIIEAALTSEDAPLVTRDLRGDDSQTFVDVIHEALDLPDLTPRLRAVCRNALREICGRYALLPRSLQVPLCYDRSDIAWDKGRHADVWKGEHRGRPVAVKVMRRSWAGNLQKIIRRFCGEAVVWGTLHHQNVLPLLGVTNDDHLFAIVLDWMEDGNINRFIKAHGDANRFELLEDVALGLIYLHNEGVIHGDLKGANVLIDENGRARLTDFGLLAIVSDLPQPTFSTTLAMAGTIGWTSPELLDPDQFGMKDSQPTKKSDCYALGMTILEVLSGRVPFAPFRDPAIIRKVIKGERPGRPKGTKGEWFTDDLWRTLEQCWSPQAEDRPDIEAVLGCLERLSVTWKSPHPGVDDDVQTDFGDKPRSIASYISDISIT